MTAVVMACPGVFLVASAPLGWNLFSLFICFVSTEVGSDSEAACAIVSVLHALCLMCVHVLRVFVCVCVCLACTVKVEVVVALAAGTFIVPEAQSALFVCLNAMFQVSCVLLVPRLPVDFGYASTVCMIVCV